MRAHPPILTRLALAGLLAALAGSGGLLACGKGVSQQLEAPAQDEASRARYGRRLLTDARVLRRDGRLKAAERMTLRGVMLLPDDAGLHHLRAELLEQLGREDEARQHRERAAELDPPPAPLPETPLDLLSRDLLVVLLPPPDEPRARQLASAEWPDGEVYRTLALRLALRLPDARVVPAPIEAGGSVNSLRRWLVGQARRAVLSLQVERAYCGESIKDGRFGLARLRVGLAAADTDEQQAGSDEERQVRYLRSEPRIDDGCRARQVARALERAFELQGFRTLLSHSSPAPSSGAMHWSRSSIRLLFPEIEQRMASALREGRRWLATGQLSAAQQAFARAAAIDPDDMDARSFLAEVDHTLDLSHQIARREERLEPARRGLPPVGAAPAPGDSWRELEPQLTVAQRRALEEQLRAERRLREDLLAVLAVIDEQHRAPSGAVLAALRPSTIRDSEAKGPRRAKAQLRRQRGDTDPARPVNGSETVELAARVLYAPGGDLLARYYFALGDETPILVEEDSSGDGQLDRWISYVDGARKEVWEERRGEELPDVHLVYADGGEVLEQIEIDSSRNGRADSVFVYRDGVLQSESRDSNGDGSFDLVEHFHDDGSLARREEDLDRDGRIDMRTTYRSGRIVRREIMNPELVPDLQ